MLGLPQISVQQPPAAGAGNDQERQEKGYPFILRHGSSEQQAMVHTKEVGRTSQRSSAPGHSGIFTSRRKNSSRWRYRTAEPVRSTRTVHSHCARPLDAPSRGKRRIYPLNRGRGKWDQHRLPRISQRVEPGHPEVGHHSKRAGSAPQRRLTWFRGSQTVLKTVDSPSQVH